MLLRRLTSLARAWRLDRPPAAAPPEECQINGHLLQSTVPPKPEVPCRIKVANVAWLTDLSPAQAKRYAELGRPAFATTPYVYGPPLSERRVAIVWPERSSLCYQKVEETSMHWYASYRTGGSTITQIFRRREEAIAAGYRLINRGYSNALEVGPMSGNPEGKLLNEQDLTRIRDKSLESATTIQSA